MTTTTFGVQYEQLQMIMFSAHTRCRMDVWHVTSYSKLVNFTVTLDISTILILIAHLNVIYKVCPRCIFFREIVNNTIRQNKYCLSTHLTTFLSRTFKLRQFLHK